MSLVSVPVLQISAYSSPTGALARLGLEVEFDEAEAQAPAVGPLEVVDEGPVVESADRPIEIDGRQTWRRCVIRNAGAGRRRSRGGRFR